MDILMMLILFNPWTRYIYFHLFASSLISSLVFYSFLSTGLLPPWLSLFLGTLFFLLLLFYLVVFSRNCGSIGSVTPICRLSVMTLVNRHRRRNFTTIIIFGFLIRNWNSRRLALIFGIYLILWFVKILNCIWFCWVAFT